MKPPEPTNPPKAVGFVPPTSKNTLSFALKTISWLEYPEQGYSGATSSASAMPLRSEHKAETLSRPLPVGLIPEQGPLGCDLCGSLTATEGGVSVLKVGTLCDDCRFAAVLASDLLMQYKLILEGKSSSANWVNTDLPKEEQEYNLHTKVMSVGRTFGNPALTRVVRAAVFALCFECASTESIYKAPMQVIFCMRANRPFTGTSTSHA